MDAVKFGDKEYRGIKQQIGNLSLVIVRAKYGYIACSYISKDTAEKVGDVAAFVQGVKDYPDLLNAKIQGKTTWADDLGIREGMSVRKALEIMDSEQEE